MRGFRVCGFLHRKPRVRTLLASTWSLAGNLQLFRVLVGGLACGHQKAGHSPRADIMFAKYEALQLQSYFRVSFFYFAFKTRYMTSSNHRKLTKCKVTTGHCLAGFIYSSELDVCKGDLSFLIFLFHVFFSGPCVCFLHISAKLFSYSQAQTMLGNYAKTATNI